jgi:hypothetical protein
MNRSGKYWHRQLIESIKESSKLHERFKKATETNIDDFDKALTIYEECCQAYGLKEITFEEFIELGQPALHANCLEYLTGR